MVLLQQLLNIKHPRLRTKKKRAGKVITTEKSRQAASSKKNFPLSESSGGLGPDQTAGIQRRIGARVLDPRPDDHLLKWNDSERFRPVCRTDGESGFKDVGWGGVWGGVGGVKRRRSAWICKSRTRENNKTMNSTLITHLMFLLSPHSLSSWWFTKQTNHHY